MRLWLLLRRRRRLLTLVATSCLAFVLISSFGLPGNIGQNSFDAFDNSDYDLNYDSVDAVHAMVRQMSSVKRRTQLQFDDEQEQLEPTGTQDKNNYLKFEPLDPKTHEIHRKRKIRLGIGDYPDIPDDVPKKYSFIHEQQKPTIPNKSAPQQEVEIQEEPEHKVPNDEVRSEDKNDVMANARQDQNHDADDRLDNAEDEDSYDADYKADEKEESIIEAQEDENEQYDEEEYDYGNPNPVFKHGDFDPMPVNASKKKTFQFEELADEDQRNRHQYDEDDGVNYEDYDRYNDAVHVAQHDTHVNGRMLHSKLSVVLDDEPKETGWHNQRNVHKVHKASTSDISRLHTPVKRQQNNGVHNNQRHLPLDTRMSNSHNGYSSYILQQFNVPNVDAKFKQNLLQNVIQTPPVNMSDWYPRPRGQLVRLPGHPAELPATQIQTPRLPRQLGPVVYSNDGYPIVEDSIFWSQKVESFLPKGLSESDVQSFKYRVNHLTITEMQNPKWNRCGRAKNQYVVLSDGTAMCARYRDPHNKLIHGEVLSFYLSRILGLDAVPAVALAKVDSNAPRWRGQNITQAQWQDGNMVAMIRWIEGLDIERSRVKMPAIMLNAYDTGSSLNRHHPAILAMTPAELSELVQWSDMVLFDYITGHYDRFASMQDGADREHKPSILAESVRNLRKVPETGKMWLIDNESGLFDAYELLYRGREDGRKFIEFHQRMLQTFCIFRQSTVNHIQYLAVHSSPDDLLLNFAQKSEPLLEQMPRTAEYKLFKGYFHTRLKEVQTWIEKCQKSH